MLDEITPKLEQAATHWRAVPLRERTAVLRRAGALLAAQRETLLDRLRDDGLSTALATNFAAWILRQGEASLLEHGARQLCRAAPPPNTLYPSEPCARAGPKVLQQAVSTCGYARVP